MTNLDKQRETEYMLAKLNSGTASNAAGYLRLLKRKDQYKVLAFGGKWTVGGNALDDHKPVDWFPKWTSHKEAMRLISDRLLQLEQEKPIRKTEDGYLVHFTGVGIHVYETVSEAELWYKHWIKLCEQTDPVDAYRKTTLDSFYWR